MSRHGQEEREINAGMHSYPNEIRGSGLDMGEVVDPDVYPPTDTHLAILFPSRTFCLSDAITNMPISISKPTPVYALLSVECLSIFLVRKKKRKKTQYVIGRIASENRKEKNDDVQSLSDQVSRSAMACNALSRSTFLGPQARISWSFPALYISY